MSIFYSPSIKGFLHDEVADTIPPDAITITDDQYASYLDALSHGQVIQVTNGAISLNMPSIALTWEDIRAKRTALLRDSDWTMLADVEFAVGIQDAWRAYRHALRTITDNFTDPSLVSWPTPPSS